MLHIDTSLPTAFVPLIMANNLAKCLIIITLIPFVFHLIESVNGPWPVPFKWPESPSPVEDYDFSDQNFVNISSSNRTIRVPSWALHPKNICRYSRTCAPSTIKFPMKLAISPRVKLSACINSDSNLSKQLEALVCYLERREFFSAEAKLPQLSQIDRFCGATNKFHSIQEMSKNIRVRLRDMRDWTFVMLTQHPLDRFIRGFIKHCIIKQDGCYGCGTDVACFLEAYQMRLLQFALYNEENYENVSGMDWDLFPQTWMCDIEQWKDQYRLMPYSQNVLNVVTNFTEILGGQYFSTIDRILRSGNVEESFISPTLIEEIREKIQSRTLLLNIFVEMYHNDLLLLDYKLIV